MMMELLSEFKQNLYRFLSNPINAVILIFVVVFAVHASSKVYTSGDSRWSVPTAMSMIKEGNTNLNEYKNDIKFYSDYGVRVVEGNYYNDFPIGVSVIALPFVYVMEKFSSKFSYPLSLAILNNYFVAVGKTEIIIGSLIIAVTAIIIYFIARKFLDLWGALLVVFIFSFCTSAWSTASRALWQHGPSMLMLSIALFLILAARGKNHLIQFVSLPLAFSYVVRPTNSVSIVLITIFVFSEYRKYFFRYILWALVVAVPFLLFNFNIYHSILSPYYMPQRIGSSSHFFEALLGNLVSPGRGVFVFSPVFIFSLVGIYIKAKKRQLERLDKFLIAAILLHWLVISSFPFWYGGWTIGPRLFSDIIPYFIYFLVPFIAEIPKLTVTSARISVSLLLILVLISFFIHYEGSTNPAVWDWNQRPADINKNPSRLWEWKDVQFLRSGI